ncbi:MAG: lipid-binding protein, partial [Daejeonella sp.]
IQAVAIWGKVACDVNQATISGQTIANSAKANNTFTIEEGKILLGQTKLHSGVMGDSIYVRYTTTFNGNTYIVKGHRRTGWNEDEY